jgi:hypothetical protein
VEVKIAQLRRPHLGQRCRRGTGIQQRRQCGFMGTIPVEVTPAT